MHKQRLAVVFASLVGIIAAFLKWVGLSIGPLEVMSAKGTEGDGVLTLIAFAICIVMVVVKDRENSVKGAFLWVPAAMGAIATAIALVAFNNLSKFETEFGSTGEISASMGIGLILTLLAGVAVLVALFVLKGSAAEASDQDQVGPNL